MAQNPWTTMNVGAGFCVCCGIAPHKSSDKIPGLLLEFEGLHSWGGSRTSLGQALKALGLRPWSLPIDPGASPATCHPHPSWLQALSRKQQSARRPIHGTCGESDRRARNRAQITGSPQTKVLMFKGREEIRRVEAHLHFCATMLSPSK